MTSTDLTLANNQHTIQLVLDLERAGALTATKLDLRDPSMSYESWESLGRFLGVLDRATRWWIGDWLNFGEAVFGEESSQGVESTIRERYDKAQRVTGLDHGTLMNIRMVCAKVAATRRRDDLGFWVHAEVAPLEPAQQENWLAATVERGWTRADLRDQIRTARNDGRDDPPLHTEGDPDPSPDPARNGVLTVCERIEAAARIVFTTGQATAEGALVPDSSWAQLRSALGEE